MSALRIVASLTASARIVRLWRWYSFALRDNGVGYLRHWRTFERVRRYVFRDLDHSLKGSVS